VPALEPSEDRSPAEERSCPLHEQRLREALPARSPVPYCRRGYAGYLGDLGNTDDVVWVDEVVGSFVCITHAFPP